MNIEDIKRHKLDLRLDQSGEPEGHPHRPEIRLWAEQEEDNDPIISMTIDSLWGQQMRFVEMSPGEARSLAKMLNQIADDIDNMMK